MARPKRTFTDEEVKLIEQYARNNCLTNTIAVALEIPLMTLKRRFGKKLKVWRAQGKIELRGNLYKQGITSPQTAIFLAKNELGMTDKQEIITETKAPEMSEAERRASVEAAKVYKLNIA